MSESASHAGAPQTPNSSTTVQHMLTSATAYNRSSPVIVYGEAQHQLANCFSTSCADKRRRLLQLET